jgi:RimJ/RimL family protein N-acetyltransferase/folate-dependent phosphoribosylglycinamide formyltransferase PurN
MSLRALTEADLPLVLSWYKLPVAYQRMALGPNFNDVENQALIERFQEGQSEQWFVYEDSASYVVGIVHLSECHNLQGTANLWFYSCPQAKSGTESKIGYEALEKAFTELKLHKINGEVLENDCFSLALLQKLGFKKEGQFRDFHFTGEKYVDVARFGMLASEWENNRTSVANRLSKLAQLRSDSSKVKYKIVILSDEQSWMNSYITDFVEEWEAAGHQCTTMHQTDEIVSGDFCFCIGFGQIVAREFRQQFRHTLVVHESDLPNGRGWSPMTWQILECSSSICVSLLEAVDNVDSGSIYLQEQIELEGTELCQEWRVLQAEATQRLCFEFLTNYPSILKSAREQQGEPSYYQRRTAKDSELDIDKTINQQFNLFRVVDNESYPAWFEFQGEKYQLLIKKYGDT